MAVTMDTLPLVVFLLTLVLGKTLGNQPPLFIREPQTTKLTTLEGNSTYIACRITQGDPYPTITWTKQGSPGTYGSREELRFDQVKIEDSGVYTCRASNTWGSDTATFTVTVYGVQAENGFVGSQSVIHNTQSLGSIMKWYNKLYLQGEGEDPSAVVSNYFRKTVFEKQGYSYDSSTGNLIIPNTQLEHEGNYTFTVFNFIKTTWSFHLLNVYLAPSDVRMTGLEDHVTESQEVNIDCTVDRVKPANVTIRWTLGSNVLETHEETKTYNGDSTFRVASRLKHSFLRRDDQEPLRCEVTHGVDSSKKTRDEKKIVVYYKYQTKVAQKDISGKPIEGQRKTLQCEVVDEGKPATKVYKWYKDNSDIVNTPGKYEGLDSDELVISNLESADDGNYGCRIQNDAGLGIQKATYRLEVLYAPKVTITGPRDAQEGDVDVTIVCSVDAKPDFTSLSWFLNGQHLENPGEDPAEYKIEMVSRSDRGTYKCQVTNEIGTVNVTHILDVTYGPMGQPRIQPNPLIMKVETTENLTCLTDSLTDRGNPELKEYIWKRENEELSATTKVIQVSPKLVTDQAMYSCAAKNTIGRSSFSQRVPVIVEAPINIEEGSFTEYEPTFNNHSFSVIFTVSGGQNIKPKLSKSSIPVSPSDFDISMKNITGVFPYGQTSAMQINHRWKLIGKDLESCDNVTYFNGDYSFAVAGTVAKLKFVKTKVFSISVQYPAMWKGKGSQDSSATKVNKTLLCEVCANPSPSAYVWSFEDRELPVRTREDGDRLHITDVSSDHFGTYSCTVYNTIHSQSQAKTFRIKLEERGSPHTPKNLMVTSRTSETLLISWKVPFDGGYDLVGFDVEYASGSKWTASTVRDCLEENKDCEKRLVGLEPDTQYRIRVRARNTRPAVKETDPFSDYAEVQGQTKVLPPLVFEKPTITESSLTVKWSMENEVEETRRRREVPDNELGLEVLYKMASEQDFQRYPRDEAELVPVTEGSVVIPGSFDPSQQYDVKYNVYEGEQRISALSSDVKTEPFIAAPATASQGGTIGGVIVGLIVAVLLVAGGVYLWHRRRAAKGSDVELRRKAVAGYHPVSNTASTESLPVHPPMLIPSSAARTDPESVRPPMTRPLRNRPPPPPQPNGQGIRESPYANVDQGGRQPAYPKGQDDNASLYENVQKLPEYENVSFPARSPQHPTPDPEQGILGPEPSSPNTTIYTDVAFTSQPQRGHQPNAVHIHGVEDRVNYAELDFAKMAEKRGTESSI